MDNPAINAPCSWQMEAFVGEISRELGPGGDYECSLGEIARRVCSTFKLKPPISELKILTFLATAGIVQKNAPSAKDTTFIYHGKMSRWEIHTRPCAPHDWSREVWHDVWEILFWRCFHRISWWREWAIEKKYHKPHDRADRFAFLLLLSPGSVPTQAKKRRYDVYEVAKFYGVPTSLAFNALSYCPKFSHPLLMAVLRLDVAAPAPIQMIQTTLDEGLFPADARLGDAVHAHVYHKVYRPASGTKTPESFSSIQQWQENETIEQMFKTLSEHFGRDRVLPILAEDPMYSQSRQIEARLWKVRHLFGLDLDTEVSVITRQSPRNSKEIFLQVVPPGEEAALMPQGADPEAAARRIANREWQRAARSVQQRSLVWGRSEDAAVGEEQASFHWTEAA